MATSGVRKPFCVGIGGGEKHVRYDPKYIVNISMDINLTPRLRDHFRRVESF
jgi:hypothetical protein